MSDALDESVSLRDELEANIDAFEGKDSTEGVVEDAPEETAPEAAPEVEAEAKEEPEKPDEEEEEKLSPPEHWPAAAKQIFHKLPKEAQQERLEREKAFDRGIQEKARQVNQYKGFAEELANTLKPLVPGWQRKGMQPKQGLAQMVALQRELNERPQETLLGLAKELGVNLEQAFQDAPYRDPYTQTLETRLEKMERERQEEASRQQREAQQWQAQQEQQAKQALYSFVNATDETGNLKYPYAKDEIFMSQMSAALGSGKAQTLEQAYQLVEGSLMERPYFKTRLESVGGQAAANNRVKVDKAKEAAKAVSSTEQADSQNSRSLRQELEYQLDKAMGS